MGADLATSASADFLVARDVVYGYETKGRTMVPPVLAINVPSKVNVSSSVWAAE